MNELTNKPWFKSINPFVLLVLLTALMTALSVLTSYQPIWANVPINIIMPIVVLLKLKPVFFERLKLSTLLLMRILIVFSVLNIFPGDLYVKIVLIFLCINILEATLTDLKRKKYCNVITGIALIASIFFINIEWLDYYYLASSKGSIGMIFWIIAYTIWNWIFVTNEFSPSIAKFHLGVLVSPLLYIIFNFNPSLWLIFRGNSLTIAGIIQISNKEYLEEKFISENFSKFVQTTTKKNTQIILMLINLALLSGMVIISLS